MCFSSDERDNVKEKESSKAPAGLITLSAQKCKYEPDSVKYEMTNYSKVNK